MITDYRPLLPYLILTLLAIGVAVADTFIKERRTPWLGWVTTAGALLVIAVQWFVPGVMHVELWNGFVRHDAFALGFDLVFLVALALTSLAAASSEHRMKYAGEFYALLTFSTIGLMIVAAAGSLLAVIVGIELSVISLLALSGFAKRELRSAEAALKLFVLGGAASAATFYGASIIYGVLRTTMFGPMSAIVSGPMDVGEMVALWAGLALVLGGIGFKISAAPFHLWAPDVYEGAPSLMVAFLSTASKAGGFAALLRILGDGLGPLAAHWAPVVGMLAALSMIVGNFGAIGQTNLKRLIAYSGIAQAGYILVAVAGLIPGDPSLAVGSVIMYLLLYAFTNVGALLLAQAVKEATGSDEVSALRGLHKRSPMLAFAALMILFSLGGIPPLAGFVGKLYLFAAGWQGAQYVLVVLGAIVSVVALYYYLMVALQVYIRDPADDRRLPVGRSLAVSLAICVIAMLAIGIYPRPAVLLGKDARAGGAAPSQRESVQAAPGRLAV